MNQWKVITRYPVDQTELSRELQHWVRKAAKDNVLFREGATISQMTFANENLVEASELDPLQIVRLFCPKFELYARRHSYNGNGIWQLRITSCLNDLPDGVQMECSGKTQVRLLGDQPDRYRRATFEYCDLDGKESSCVLEANLFRPESAFGDRSDSGNSTYEEETICCWTSINKLPSPDQQEAGAQAASHE